MKAVRVLLTLLDVTGFLSFLAGMAALVSIIFGLLDSGYALAGALLLAGGVGVSTGVANIDGWLDARQRDRSVTR